MGEELWDNLGWHGPARPQPAARFLAGHELGEGHALWRKGDYTSCGACGAWALQRPISLLGPGGATSAGAPLEESQLDALSRLRRGMPPRQGAAGWAVSGPADGEGRGGLVLNGP